MIPNYKQIFSDMLNKKYPEKKAKLKLHLEKEHLSALDIIKINREISGTPYRTSLQNQKLRSYSQSDIFKILEYQKKKQINNTETAQHFKISRNTIAKWKKIYSV